MACVQQPPAIGLEVTDPTLRVLYMEGTPQQDSSPIPEWKYLKDALQFNIQVTVLYRQGGEQRTIPQYGGFGSRDRTAFIPWSTPPGFRAPWNDCSTDDVVIHSDIRISSFTLEQLTAISAGGAAWRWFCDDWRQLRVRKKGLSPDRSGPDHSGGHGKRGGFRSAPFG